MGGIPENPRYIMEYREKDELKEELNKLEKANPYERLAYIRSLIKFYKQVELYDRESINELYISLLRATKGYDK